MRAIGQSKDSIPPQFDSNQYEVFSSFSYILIVSPFLSFADACKLYRDKRKKVLFLRLDRFP